MDNIFAHTLFIGKNVINLPKCHSTNTYAARLLAEKGASEGTVIITEHQTAGRGQRGNSWEAATGKNLTFSVILKPSFLHIQEQFYLNVITSLAIYDLLTEFLPFGLSVKWPNDLYHYRQKMAGILIENSLKNQVLEWSVLGIGLNINQNSFENENAGSLVLATGKEFSLSVILEKLLLRIEQRYLQLRAGEYQGLRKEYLSRLYWLGEIHTFRSENKVFAGKIIGIDKAGKLAVVMPHDEVRYFGLKEIEFIE